MEYKDIDNRIGYYPAGDNPLSANVIVLEGNEAIWLYDVGNDPSILPHLADRDKRLRIILSHFHPDHIGNLDKLSWSDVYQGKNTFRYTGVGNIITEEQLYTDGPLRLRIFPIPSSHARGSLALEVNGSYCFLGDALYPASYGEKGRYNAGLLQEQIEILRQVEAPFFCLSHKEPFEQSRDGVIRWLESILQKREKGNPYIYC